MKKKIKVLAEEKIFLIVILIYIISVAIRFIIANFDKVAVVEPDEIRYLKWAVSFHNDGKISLNNITRLDSPLLYSLYISLAYFFSDKMVQLMAISLLNCLALCSTVFPTYLLARKKISSKKLQLIVVLLVVIMPDMTMSMTFMAENLYIPICVWFFYFVDQYFSNDSIKMGYEILLALFCTILYAVKDVALYFVVSLMVVLILKAFINKENCNKRERFAPIIFIVSFICFFCIYKYIIVKYLLINNDLLSLGGTEFAWQFNKIYDFLFYIYLNVFANMNTFVAFLYFPIALPILIYPVLEKKR